MGIGPLVAWRRASLRALGKTFAWPIGRRGRHRGRADRRRAPAARRRACSRTRSRAFVLASIVLEFVRGTRATGSLLRLVARNRRRYGGYIVHASVVLLAIGIAGSSAYGTIREMQPDARASRWRSPGYTLTYAADAS